MPAGHVTSLAVAYECSVIVQAVTKMKQKKARQGSKELLYGALFVPLVGSQLLSLVAAATLSALQAPQTNNPCGRESLEWRV